jgi:hypothetical protein
VSKKTYLFLSFILLSCLMTWTDGEGATQQYTLTVTKAGSGNGKITSSPAGINCPSDCTEVYKEGKKVTLKAKPDNDSSFAGWAGGGCTGINPCSVIMDDDETVVATFDLKTPKISLSTDSLEFDLGSKKKVSQTLGISNIGTGNLIVTASVEGADFSITGKSTFVVKPNKSYKLKVTYAPSVSGTLEADVLATHEPTSGDRESEVEASSESGDIEPSPEGSDDQSKLKLSTNDPQNPEVEVELAPLVQPQPKSAFINVPTWQLDITWSANDAYEDGDWSAKLEMTATARYILMQRDKRPDSGWGRWGVESVQSWNMTYSSFLVDKRTNARTDYSATNQLTGAEAAVFQVGSFYNPSGYELHAGLAPYLKVTSTVVGIGPEGLVALLIDDPSKPPPSGFCTSPLPTTGLTIHGSLVIPFCVPPFCGGAGNVPDTTRVGIQFVLQPYLGK